MSSTMSCFRLSEWLRAGRLTNISPLTAAGCCAQRSVSNRRKGSSLVQHCHSGLVSSFCTSTPLPPSLARHSPEELSPPGGSHGEAAFGQSTSSEAQVEQQMALRSHAPCGRVLRQAGDTDKLLACSPEALLTFAHSAVWLLLEDDTGDSLSLCLNAMIREALHRSVKSKRKVFAFIFLDIKTFGHSDWL